MSVRAKENQEKIGSQTKVTDKPKLGRSKFGVSHSKSK
jgi:hypothetical protein